MTTGISTSAAVEIKVSDLTEATLVGDGVFDILMRATKAHLDEEYTKNRIKGPEYATVYLGSLNSVMDKALQFLLNKQKSQLEAELIGAQIRQTEAQVTLTIAQAELARQQKLNAENEWLLLAEQRAKLVAETGLIGQQEANLVATLPQIVEQTKLTEQQRLNAITEELMMHKQICKLEAEYDLTMEQKVKVSTETDLLGQKIQTEKAQTTGVGVAEDSVIGKQKKLYHAQADGFQRDAELKVAKVMVDSWNTRRMTDEGTVADGVNRLNDTNVGRAVNKLLTGVNA